jgi:protein involved in polysaccharide export with SLBB domain
MNRIVFALLLAAMTIVVPETVLAQTNPTPAQAQAAMSDPAIRARILAQIRSSGMTPDQIRAQLKSMGYSDDVIGQLVGAAGVDTTATLSEDVFAAVRSLGIMDPTTLDSLRMPVAVRRRTRAAADSILLDSLEVALQNDTLRAAILRLLASPAARRVGSDSGFILFGRDVFERQTKQFEPSISGPLPPNYRVGVGDRFMLVFTGDFQRTEELTVTPGGWVVAKDAGQIPAANLTFEQLRTQLASRLSRVYSGISSGTTRFDVLPSRVGTNQIFVLGDVKAPNSYPISRLGTVLTALYAAGGPTEKGDARSVEVQRNNKVIATVDLYDYLTTGSSASDVRLENGDIVFVRPMGGRVRVAGAVVRPATYDLKPGESVADAIRMAGGFRPEADRRRVQIERIIPATRRDTTGTGKEVIDIVSPLLATSYGPTTALLEPGDVIRIYTVEPIVANRIDVQGNVFQPSPVAFVPGMRLSQALARAGGLKPDSYRGSVQISRLQSDSTRRLTRVEIGADGRPSSDIEMAPNDVVRAFSVTEFRTERYVTVGGAVKKPGRIPYQEGMTMRDAIMLAGGLEESALLTHVEIGRLPDSRENGVTAITIVAPLDSTYLFERGPDGKYLGPPGVQVPSAHVPEQVLKPYDAIAVLRQPDFEYQRTVSVSGRVRLGGTYVLKSKTERLYDVLQRAGGLASDADSSAIVFIRQRDTTGRIGVNLPEVLRNPKYVDNLILADRDSIFIPPINSVVLVRGEVNSPASAVAYVRGADLDYYIRSAGGGTTKADAGKAYVVQPSGKVETKHRTALLYMSIPHPLPGAVVQVPMRDPNDRGADWAAITQLAVTTLATLTTTALLIINSNNK